MSIVNNKISVAKPVIVEGVDSPLDARTRCNNVNDFPDIEAPFIGMIIYTTDDDKYWKVTKLKPKLIGSMLIENYQIDSYEEFFNNKSQNVTSDYTAFEVFAHDTDINVGDIDEVTGIAYAERVSAQMTHKMILRTSTPKEQQDVVVDWGDDTIDSVKDGDFEAELSDNHFVMSHTYQTPGRYIVKIFGKQYYAVKYSDSQYPGIPFHNLICRVLDHDLPIASHLTNLSSFCFEATCLQKVNVPKYADYLSRIINTASMFNFCRNLVSVKGFSNYTNPAFYSYGSMFGACTALTECDFRMSPYVTGNHIDRVFDFCSSLTVDINALLPTQNFQASKLSVDNIFSNSGITGTVPAGKLWEDFNIEWTDTETAFIGCSDEIRAQVPVSWGGTNKLLDAEMIINTKVSDKNDYTAFEVFAHNYDIPVGECAELGGYVSNLIPASMTHNFVLRTMCQDYTKSDVVIDWGDGETSIIAEGQYNKDPENTDVEADTANGEANYTFSHTYAENGKYIVKIYGKQYYNINNLIKPASGYDNIKSSLICRVFDSDLPLALHLNNLASTCAYSDALLYVNAANIKYRYFINATAIFAECKNLLEAVEFKRNFINANCSSAHTGNISLRKTDMQIPFKSLYPGAAHQQYLNCWNLEVDIASLFPEVQGLVNCNFSFYRTFYECKKLYGTVPADKLWNNKYLNVQAEPTSQTFKDCPAEILAQVPKEWGGTATEDYGNFVTGEQSAVLCGEGNKVYSDYSFAAGFMNTISAGDDPENKNTKCFAIGGGNTLDGNGVITIGYNNQAVKYTDGTDGGIAIGGGNTLAGQDNLLIGTVNRNNTGINIIAIGTGIKNVTGNRSITIGSNITNKQEQGIVIGDSVETNSLDCRGAVFLNGHRFRKMRVDELDSTEMLDCFRHEYKGTSKPVMQEFSISGTTAVTLDIDQYSRFMLRGNGTADIEAVNMQNGDGWELFVNTSETSLILDSDIVGGDAIYDAIPGPHLIRFMYLNETVFCEVAGSSGTGGIVDLSGITINEKGEWCIDGQSTGVSALGKVNAVISETEPENPTDGMIWITE